MVRIVASAPGKVVLSGEYAVLDGAPAIAMAVNRRATVSIDAGAGAAVSTPGLAGGPDTRLLDLVCKELDIERPDAHITLDTSSFVDAASGAKLGIGSSAALTVALVSALAPGDTRVDTFASALRAHRRFQDGRGSGVDIAASSSGGLIEYHQGGTPEPLAWPADLSYVLLWSGITSSTASKLASFGRQTAHPSRKTLLEASGFVADLWRQGDAAALVDGLRDYVDSLVAFDVDHELGIFDAGHDTLAKHETQHNVVYKPCGAGGGDVGIVLGTDADEVSRFVAFAESRGFRKLGMQLDAMGASVTREQT